MKYWFSILLLFICSTAAANTFTLDYCDFSVDFPSKYSTREIYVKGSTTIAAMTTTANNTWLEAECWPYIKQLSLHEYARESETEFRNRGIFIKNIVVNKDASIAPQVITSGRIQIGGENYHTTSVSFMGPRSRLDLNIVEREIGSKEHSAFRNSVKRK